MELQSLGDTGNPKVYVVVSGDLLLSIFSSHERAQDYAARLSADIMEREVDVAAPPWPGASAWQVALRKNGELVFTTRIRTVNGLSGYTPYHWRITSFRDDPRPFLFFVTWADNRDDAIAQARGALYASIVNGDWDRWEIMEWIEHDGIPR